MSKSIALGLLGAGAILLAILLAGCTGAPSPAATAGPTHQPETTELGGAGSLQQCEQRTWLAMTSGISATQASTQRRGMALSRWCCAGKPLVLTFLRRRKGRDWERTRQLGRLGQASAREFAPFGAGGR